MQIRLFGVPLSSSTPFDLLPALPPFPRQALATPGMKAEPEAVAEAERDAGRGRGREAKAEADRPVKVELGLSLSAAFALTPSASTGSSCPSSMPLFTAAERNTLPSPPRGLPLGFDLNSPVEAESCHAGPERDAPAGAPLPAAEASEGQHSSQGSLCSAQGRSSSRSGKLPASAGTSAGAKVACNRYEVQKIRDWQAFEHYLGALRPPVSSRAFRGEHVVQFLLSLDQFGKTKIHEPGCVFFGTPAQRTPCGCTMRQAWGSLDSLIGRLRAAFEESGGGRKEENPFGDAVVRHHLREVREAQAQARGMNAEKKRKRRGNDTAAAAAAAGGAQSRTRLKGGASER